MGNTNDEKILQLKKVVAGKQEELKKLKSKNKEFNTNLVLDFDGMRNNLHVLSPEALKFLVVKLGMYNREAEMQEVELKSGNWTLSQWIEDIHVKIRQNEIKTKEAQLKTMEVELDKRLSEDTKTKIDIDNFEDLLKNL